MFLLLDYYMVVKYKIQMRHIEIYDCDVTIFEKLQGYDTGHYTCQIKLV